MDLIKLTCDFEVWKIANSLAEEFYPVNYPEERKADRERLIDFKDGLRNIKKSKHTLERNLEELDKLLSYLNPKRRCCLLYTSPSPRDVEESRMPSSA